MKDKVIQSDGSREYEPRNAGMYRIPVVTGFDFNLSIRDCIMIIGTLIIMVGLCCCGSTGGGKFFCGYEEQNSMKNVTGYEVPEKYKK